MTRLWRDHSLTIVLAGLGVTVSALAWLLPEGKGFDTVLGIGQGLLSVALFYAFSGRFRETNRPEE